MVDQISRPTLTAGQAAAGVVPANIGYSIGAGLAVGDAGITAAAAANALTTSVKTRAGSDPSPTNPVFVGLRSQAGAYDLLVIDAVLSLTIPNTATMGVPGNNIPFRLWKVVFDDNGTPRIGLRNCSQSGSIFALAEWGVASSVAMSTAADSAGVFYTDVAVTDKPFRVIGFYDFSSGLSAIGVWASNPTNTVLFGPGVKLPGDTVQTVINATTTQTDLGSSISIPYDTSIPQNTEGAQVFSTAITPVSPVNILENEVDIIIAAYGTVTSVVGVTLFKDSGADAIRAIPLVFTSVQERPHRARLIDRRVVGSAGATTFKVRAGPPGGSTGLVVNSDNSGTALYGNTWESTHRITEVMG